VTLREVQVRDDFWSRLDPGDRMESLRLLTALTQLAWPGYVTPAATLLAFVAWQCGNGALANVALDRALGHDPDYGLAKLIRQAADAGLPPGKARVPLTPEEVAEAYARRAASPKAAAVR
jgi:hypothetical protein